jgi:hypothetical protein
MRAAVLILSVGSALAQNAIKSPLDLQTLSYEGVHNGSLPEMFEQQATENHSRGSRRSCLPACLNFWEIDLWKRTLKYAWKGTPKLVNSKHNTGNDC